MRDVKKMLIDKTSDLEIIKELTGITDQE